MSDEPCSVMLVVEYRCRRLVIKLIFPIDGLQGREKRSMV